MYNELIRYIKNSGIILFKNETLYSRKRNRSTSRNKCRIK